MSKTSWLAAALLLCMTPMASASVAIQGTGAWGSFTGTLDYSFTNATTAQLVLDITNTSPAANGGYLVAVVLNMPSAVTGIPSFSTDTNLNYLMGGTNNSVSANPFGDFDFGVVQDDNPRTFEGAGGSPSGGIAVGDSGNFVFGLTGAGLDLLSTSSFINELTSDGKFMAARFKGFENDESDKVPGTEVIPEPASLAVWGCIALVGIPYGVYRRRQAAKA
jgi:hypothetical protein